jgi:signal peptidase I
MITIPKDPKPQQANNPAVLPMSWKHLSDHEKLMLSIRKTARFSIYCIIILAVFVLLLRFVIEPFSVDGISMQPTFHTGDVVLVWRWPQTWAELTNGQYIPDRTNLVVVKKLAVSEEQLIKRVIGLPGDSVVIANGQVTIYNKLHPLGFNPDAAPFGKNLLPTQGTYSTQVGVNQLFLMGDNRQLGASIDSRSSLGNVSSNDIIGKVIIRVYPFGKLKVF